MLTFRAKQTILVLLACAAAVCTAAGAEPPKRIDVPAGELISALQVLEKQSDVEFVYRAAQLKGVRTKGVSGTFTVQEAVRKLIEGTQVHMEVDAATGAMLISNLGAGSAKTTGATGYNDAAAAEQLSLSLKRYAGEGKSFWQRSRLAEAATPASPEAQSSSAEESPGGAQKGAGLDEIIVTAQKRDQRLIDVPSSLHVLTADDIDRRGVTSSEEYLRGVPGVNQVGSGGAYSGQLIVIRGMETTLRQQNYFSGPTTATYFGEIPMTNSAGPGGGSNVDVKLVDIERVEVLRGPQGTAFGSSSLGGVVRTIPVAPKFNTLEGRIGAGYSTTSGTGGENHLFQGVINIPVVADRLAIRAVAYAFSDSGYYRNVAGSDAAFQTAFVIPNSLQAFATDEEQVGDYYVAGGRIAALFQPTDKLRFTFSYLSQKNESDGFPLSTSGTFEQTLIRVAPEHVVRGQYAGLDDYSIHIPHAVIEYDFGWADLLATYSHIDGESKSMRPYGPGGLFGNTLPFPASSGRSYVHRENTGELRVATKLEGAWNFIVGAYAEQQYDEQYADIYAHGDPTVNLLHRRYWGDFLDRRNLKQQAAFGEASWQFLPRFTLTGGIRAYEYERTIRVDPTGLFGSVSGRDDTDASGTNFRTNLSYKPGENSLLYVGWAQGFRLGKPQPAAPAGLCDTNNDGILDGTGLSLESSGHVDSDSVDSYEIGGKMAVLDRRLTLDAAVFRMDWSNVPVNSFLPCGWSYLANAGRARSEGIELQARWRLSNGFSVDFGGSWTDARVMRDVPAEGFAAGDPLPSPELTGNLGLQYEFSIAGHEAFVRTDSVYVDSFYGDVRRSPNTESGGYVKLDFSARLALQSMNVDLFVQNVTNDDAFSYRGSTNYGEFYGFRLRPRTVGVRFSYGF